MSTQTLSEKICSMFMNKLVAPSQGPEMRNGPVYEPGSHHTEAKEPLQIIIQNQAPPPHQLKDHLYATCDRCHRTFDAEYTSPMKEAWRHGAGGSGDQGPVIISAGSVQIKDGAACIRIPPTACPNHDDCLDNAHPDYIHSPLLDWPGRHKGLDTIHDAAIHHEEWAKKGFPPRRFIDANAEFWIREYAKSFDSTDAWMNYLAWRYIWIQHTVYRVVPHADLPSYRMWGHLIADRALVTLGILKNEVIPALYGGVDIETAHRIMNQDAPDVIRQMEAFAGISTDIKAGDRADLTDQFWEGLKPLLLPVCDEEGWWRRGEQTWDETRTVLEKAVQPFFRQLDLENGDFGTVARSLFCDKRLTKLRARAAEFRRLERQNAREEVEELEPESEPELEQNEEPAPEPEPELDQNQETAPKPEQTQEPADLAGPQPVAQRGLSNHRMHQRAPNMIAVRYDNFRQEWNMDDQNRWWLMVPGGMYQRDENGKWWFTPTFLAHPDNLR